MFCQCRVMDRKTIRLTPYERMVLTHYQMNSYPNLLFKKVFEKYLSNVGHLFSIARDGRQVPFNQLDQITIDSILWRYIVNYRPVK